MDIRPIDVDTIIARVQMPLHPPYDAQFIAEQLGYTTLFTELPTPINPKYSGVVHHHRRIIYINKNIPGEAMNFTIARLFLLVEAGYPPEDGDYSGVAIGNPIWGAQTPHHLDIVKHATTLLCPAEYIRKTSEFYDKNQPQQQLGRICAVPTVIATRALKMFNLQ